MGMHGWKHVNKAIQSADLLIALGMRFDDRVTGKVSTYAPGARIIHVDIDPSEIGKNVAVDVPIVGDVGRVLRALTPLVSERRREERDAYFAELAEWRRESEGAVVARLRRLARRPAQRRLRHPAPRRADRTTTRRSSPTSASTRCGWRATPASAGPNSHLSSGGLGTMGYSMPAGMGAALGRPDKETWAIAGDGGFQMTLQELATLVQDRIPVKVALMDNKKLGMIRQWQEIIYGGNYHSASLSGPDYLKLCEAYGIPAFKATAPDEVDDAIRAAQAVDGPALVWFEIAEEQNVFPMMPAGKGLSDLIEKWGGADE